MQPFLEQAESADVLQGGGVPDNLDEAVAFQGVRLFTGDDAVVDPAGLNNRQGEGVFGFRGGEAEGCLDGCLPHHFMDVFQLRRFDDAIEHGVQSCRVGQVEIHVGDLVFEFGGEFQPAAEQDDGVAVGLGDAQRVLDATHEHGVALIEVELQIPEQHDVAWLVRGEDAVQKLEGIEWIRARGDAPFLYIGKTLGGGPGEEFAFQGGACAGDFRFGTRLLGADDGEAGVSGT